MMKKIVLTYGAIAGVIVMGLMLITINLASIETELAGLEWLGYLTMILALSLVFMGIKKYRDVEQGGVIKFSKALIVGLGISVIASIVYVVIWEINLAATDYAFIEDYSASVIETQRAEGATESEMAKVIAETERAKEQYGKPLFRIMISFSEIFPVGLLISLISAAILRKSEVLPATA